MDVRIGRVPFDDVVPALPELMEVEREVVVGGTADDHCNE
jgi:hypothetical protein